MNKATFNYVPDEPEKAEEPAVSHETPEAKPEPSAPEPAKEAGEPAQESAGELIALDKINPIQVFSTENGLDPLIKRIKEEVEKEVLDPSDEKGRTRIRSLARKIGGAKMRLKEMGQGLTEDWRQKTKAVTTETSRMEKEIDAIRDAVLKPLEEYEARAAERKAKFENRINEILTAADFFEPLTADELKARIDKITVLYKHEWEEFEVRATQAWEQVKPKLYKLLEERTKYEADQAELERLRQEKEESERKERHEAALKKMSDLVVIDEDQLSAAKIAGNKSGLLAIYDRDWEDYAEKAEALRNTLVEQLDAMYAEQHKKEQDAIREEERQIANKVRIDNHNKALEKLRGLGQMATNHNSAAYIARIAEVETAYDREWEEFSGTAKELHDTATKYLTKQKTDAEDRERKEQTEREEKIKLDAQEAERQKQKQEADQAEAERQKREADKKHRKGIDDAAEKAIVTLLEALNDDYESSAKAIVEAIAAGKVPHVKIEY